MDRRLIALPLVALALVLLAWISMQGAVTGGEPALAPSAAPGSKAGPRSASVDGANEPATAQARASSGAGARAAGARGQAGDGAQDTDAPVEGVALGEGEVGDPIEARIQRIDEAVTLVLTTVAPELDESQITRRCSGDGKSCTFEGPWPGDDFLGRWVRALGTDELAKEDLGGVTFRTFEPVDKGGQRLFHIVAVSPDAPPR